MAVDDNRSTLHRPENRAESEKGEQRSEPEEGITHIAESRGMEAEGEAATTANGEKKPRRAERHQRRSRGPPESRANKLRRKTDGSVQIPDRRAPKKLFCVLRFAICIVVTATSSVCALKIKLLDFY